MAAYFSNVTFDHFNFQHFNFQNTDDRVKIKNEFIPKQIIVNNKTTICIWKDGSKTKVTCSEDDVFTVEAGVASCIAKKLFGSRSAFLKTVEKAYIQPEKSK